MPNFDGGHYFYTGLFPVRLDPVQRPDGSYTVPSHLLREALATLPNFSEALGPVRTSPFARCHATHFARLAVIDDPAFNGRDAVNSILGAKVDLLKHQPVDHLSRAWLLFTADFDAADEGARDRWAAGLWPLMEAELRQIFGHCEGFDEVTGPDQFARYLARGQIETTMSFNDYWIDPPPFPSLSFAMIGGLALAVLLVVLALGWLAQSRLHLGWWIWPAAALLGLALGLWSAYKFVNARGAKPFPTAPDSDLKSVLKGLYLQQNFVPFAIAQQGADPDQLYEAFGRFIERVRPDALDDPTQPRGVLRA